jgi:hypothetical protein
MDIERAVEHFVSQGKELFYSLRVEGEALSGLGLRTLQTQLHILTIESARLQHARAYPGQNTRIPAVPKKSKWPPLHSPNDQCSHSRLIDDFVSLDGQSALVYCLECRAIIQDPHLQEK